jgi:hypothetical protein
MVLVMVGTHLQESECDDGQCGGEEELPTDLRMEQEDGEEGNQDCLGAKERRADGEVGLGERLHRTDAADEE